MCVNCPLSDSHQDKLCEDIALKDANVAESSTKNVNHSFSVSACPDDVMHDITHSIPMGEMMLWFPLPQVITPHQQVLFSAPSRKSMEEWMTAFRVASLQTVSCSVLVGFSFLGFLISDIPLYILIIMTSWREAFHCTYMYMYMYVYVI